MGSNRGNNYGHFYSFQSKPVLLDGEFTVTPTDAAGTTSVKGQGISNVFMHTSTTPVAGNPNPADGYAIIELAYNYTRNYGGAFDLVAPTTGSDLAINATALTAGLPYVITVVGTGAAGVTTIAPTADTAGSLAGKYFKLFDSYGNTFIIWFSVSGVGSAPTGVSGTLVQQSITSGDTAATIGAALAITIAALPSGISGVFSFTAAGTTTVTVTSTKLAPLAGPAADGTSGFTFALTKYTTNLQDWQGVGVPAGVTPAVGVAFIATATGYTTGGASTGKVKAVGKSSIQSVELIGGINTTISLIPMGGSPHSGGYLILQFMGPTSSSVTTPIPTAPAAGTVVKFSLLLESGARVGGNNE